MLTTRSVVSIFTAALLILCTSVVSGQNFPSKPIRILCGGAGGSNDAIARLIAQGISGPLGQPVVVENRASGAIAAPAVAQSPPDGYTLMLVGDLLWLAPLLRDNPPWDPLRDFSPVGMLDGSPNVLVVHPSLPVKTVKELIALAKSRPGELNYGATGVGGLDHIGMELFNSMAGVKIVRITYKGGASAVTGLVSGEVQMRLPSMSTVAAEIKSGRVRALAVAGMKRSALFPELPTMAASGLPGFEIAGIDGLYAAAKTPAAVITRLNQEVVRYLRTSEANEKIMNLGGEVLASSPEEHAAALKSRVTVLGKVIKDAGIKAE